MSDACHEHEQERFDFDHLESMVRAASVYVQPTDDFRPKALEAVRNACRKRRASRRLSGMALLVLLGTLAGFPDRLFLSYPGIVAVHSTELHRRAARNVAENGTETNWALVEVFRDLRREHAVRLRHFD